MKQLTEKRKYILVVFIILGIISIARRHMMETDITLIQQFKKPIYCIEINELNDDGFGEYRGLFYSFEVETFFPETMVPVEIATPKFTAYTIKNCGKIIQSRSIDFDWDEFEGVVCEVKKKENSDEYYIWLEDCGIKKILISDVTEYKNTNSLNTYAVKVGDVIKVDVVYFKFLLEKENVLYSAHTIYFASN
jgi:hypothetical protein